MNAIVMLAACLGTGIGISVLMLIKSNKQVDADCENF